MESFSHYIKVILLLVIFTGPQNILGLPSSSPSPIFQKTKEIQPNPEIVKSDINQRPQVQPGVIVAQDERDYYNVVNQNTRPTQQITRQEFNPQVQPAVLPGPAQPSSDILPPPESLDQDFFVNVKTKPTEVSSSSNLKTKRDNSNEDDLNSNAQQPMARFLLPGLNINWGGGEITSIPESSLECPSASPIAPNLLHCGLKECSEDSECFGERKCCRYACALICVDPVKKPSSSVISSNHYVSKDAGQNSLELPPLISTVVVNQGNNNNNNYEKPGSCYRPNNNNYYVGSGYNNNNNGYRNDYNNNFGRVKRQTAFGSSSYTPYSNNQFGSYPGNNNNGGWQGGYNPGNNNNAGGWQGGNGIGTGYQQCYRDSDCSGTLKCCNRQCRTPAYFG